MSQISKFVLMILNCFLAFIISEVVNIEWNSKKVFSILVCSVTASLPKCLNAVLRF
jgi:hypothetical protein